VSEMSQLLKNLLQAVACLAHACETEGRELNSDRLKMFNLYPTNVENWASS
jgi:hypothetical protein